MSVRGAWSFLLLGLAVHGVAVGQSFSSHPALSGFVYDPGTRALRAIPGIPGSAYAGHAVASDLDMAWPSATGAAVAIRGGEAILLTALETPAVREHRDHQLIVPAQVVWSPSGTVALLYSPGAGVIQRLTVSPEVSAAPPLPVGFLGQELTAIAISDSARIAFVAGGSLYLLHESAPREIAGGIATGALAFAADDLLYAAGESAVTAFHISQTGAATARQIAEGRHISGLTVSRKTGRLFGIDPSARRLVIYDPVNSTSRELDLERTPSTLQILKTDSILLLNGIEAQGSPLIVLDIANDPTVFFIPVDGSRV
jgi:hypothetical protein